MDPYKVLGVTPQATDDEIKKAYRRLSRKYHPDANVNSAHPEVAEEKFKQVQTAYDQIMKMRERGASGYGGQSYGGFGGYGGRTSGQDMTEEEMHLQAALNYVNSAHYQEAMRLLNSMENRSAKWYFAHAAASVGMGNREQAITSARRAVEMEPNNLQYRSLLQRLQQGDAYGGYGGFGGFGPMGGGWYQSMGNEYGRPMSGADDMCCRFMIIPLCCGCPGPCC